MPHSQTISAVDPELIIRELDELDRVVHRLRTRLATTTPQRIARICSRSAWSATYGAIGLERGKMMMKYITQSRRKGEQRLAALLQLPKQYK